jgi:hypothetical protein
MKTRQHPRHLIDIQGRYRIGNGINKDVIVNDISIRGCSMFDRFSNLEIGGFVSIRIGSIGPIEAFVRWRRKNEVGIEFSYPLHAAVLEHMLSTVDGWSPS